jgi:hypothetical protein
MMTECVDESALFTPSVTSKKKATLPLGDGDGDSIKKMKPWNKQSLPPEFLSGLTNRDHDKFVLVVEIDKTPTEVPRWGKSFWLHNH